MTSVIFLTLFTFNVSPKGLQASFMIRVTLHSILLQTLMDWLEIEFQSYGILRHTCSTQIQYVKHFLSRFIIFNSAEELRAYITDGMVIACVVELASYHCHYTQCAQQCHLLVINAQCNTLNLGPMCVSERPLTPSGDW